jgi:hypothetical protein
MSAQQQLHSTTYSNIENTEFGFQVYNPSKGAVIRGTYYRTEEEARKDMKAVEEALTKQG